MRELKELKREAWELRGEILKDLGAIVGLPLLGIICILLESIAKFSRFMIIYRSLNGENPLDCELESLSLFEEIPYRVESLRENIRDLRDTKREIKNLKVETLPVNNIPTISDVQFNNAIINRIRELLVLCENLSGETKRSMLIELKGILVEYTTRYKESLKGQLRDNGLELSSLEKEVSERLTAIEEQIKLTINVQEQVTNISSEQTQLLSMIEQEEKPLTLRKTKK